MKNSDYGQWVEFHCYDGSIECYTGIKIKVSVYELTADKLLKILRHGRLMCFDFKMFSNGKQVFTDEKVLEVFKEYYKRLGANK